MFRISIIRMFLEITWVFKVFLSNYAFKSDAAETFQYYQQDLK